MLKIIYDVTDKDELLGFLIENNYNEKDLVYLFNKFERDGDINSCDILSKLLLDLRERNRKIIL